MEPEALTRPGSEVKGGVPARVRLRPGLCPRNIKADSALPVGREFLPAPRRGDPRQDRLEAVAVVEVGEVWAVPQRGLFRIMRGQTLGAFGYRVQPQRTPGQRAAVQGLSPT